MLSDPDPDRLAARRVALVVNPTAGRGLAARMLPEIMARLTSAGAAVDVAIGRDFDEARVLVNEVADAAPDVLAVVGGDGMMHLAINACARPAPAGRRRPALALIPAGTGNDYCRGLGFDVTDTMAAVDLVITGAPHPLDVALVAGAGGETIVGSVVATGFDALVNARANALRWPRGSLRYTVAALRELATFRPLRYRLRLDGEWRELDAMFVAIGTTSTYGGGMQICVGADPADGWLDLTIVHPVRRATLLRLLPRTFSGAFATDPCVEQLRVREVVVDGVTASGSSPVAFGDGEPIGPLPLTLTVRPGALSVFLPAG